MPIPVVSFGSLSLVKDIPVGNVLIMPSQEKTVIAMMVSTPSEKRLVWISEPPRDDEVQFDLIDSAFYAQNKALVVDDAAFVLSEHKNHMLSWENQKQPGIVVRTENKNIILLGRDIRMRRFIDLATGVLSPSPDQDSLALTYTSWSVVRRFQQDGKTVTIPLCDWELPS
jgi:hypothetical protein